MSKRQAFPECQHLPPGDIKEMAAAVGAGEGNRKVFRIECAIQILRQDRRPGGKDDGTGKLLLVDVIDSIIS